MTKRKRRSSSRKRYFYWKYRREHPEKFSKRKKREIALAEELGASKPMAAWLSNTSNGNVRYRVRYGYVNEHHLADTRNSRLTRPVASYEKALNKYKALHWLRDRDPKGRKFIVIEKSSDGGLTWPTKLFHDCQR